MSRLIVDEYVRQNTETEDSMLKYVQMKQSFPGTVSDDFKKVKLEGAAFKFQTVGLNDSLLRNMEKVQPNEEECFLSMKGALIPVKKKEFCILKALAVEQVTKCKPYSEVVAYIFMNFLIQVVNRKELYLFEPNADWTGFQKKMFDIVVAFILEQVGQKKAVEVQEVE